MNKVEDITFPGLVTRIVPSLGEFQGPFSIQLSSILTHQFISICFKFPLLQLFVLRVSHVSIQSEKQFLI